MAVPHTGSEVWTATLLGGNETAPWRPWMVAGQVAGFVVDYGRLSYATVKGAGHMVGGCGMPSTDGHMAACFFH